MALSFVELNPTSGGQTVFDNINLQFVSTEDIFVTIKKADGTVLTLLSSQYNVTASPTLTVTITDSAVSSDIATNDTIRIFRDTDVSSPARIFSNGSVLKASDLNANHNQILFAQQENDELGIGDALQKDASNAFWDANSLNIRNLADAVEATDAITLGQVNAALASAGSVPSVPQAYSTASGTLSNGTFANSNTTFSMNPPPTSEFEQTFIVEIDGVIQRPNNDYTITSGTTEGTLTIIGADVTTASVVVTNFGLSRQVFDFPTIGTAITDSTTPITLNGHPSQKDAFPIFLVNRSNGTKTFRVDDGDVTINGDSGDNYPLSVRNTLDGSTGILRLGSHGNIGAHIFADPTEFGQADGRGFFYQINDTNNVPRGADDMFVLRRSTVNDGGNDERGTFITVKGNTGVANGNIATDVFRVGQNGKLFVNATDDTIAGQADEMPLLTLRSQHSSDVEPCPYISMSDSNNVTRHVFNRASSQIGGGNDDLDHTLIIGKQDPSGSRPNIMRSAARPSDDNITGEGSTAYYWRFFLNGTKAAGNRHCLLTLNSANRNELTAINIRRTVTPGQSYPSNAIQMLYNGRILLNDTEAFRGPSDVLRKDEVAKAAGITLCTKNSTTTVLSVTYLGANGIGLTTANDTSTYTIASNNPQLNITQSNGVLTVPAGTFLTTVAVDAYHDSGTVRPGANFSIQLLKNGSVVAETRYEGNGNSNSVGVNMDEVPFSLNYSELIYTTGNTTYQLRAQYSEVGAAGGGFLTRNIRLRRKSVQIQHLGEG